MDQSCHCLTGESSREVLDGLRPPLEDLGQVPADHLVRCDVQDGKAAALGQGDPAPGVCCEEDDVRAGHDGREPLATLLEAVAHREVAYEARNRANILRQICDGDLDRELRAVGAHAGRLEDLARVLGAVGLAAGASPAMESLEMLGREQDHGRTADHLIVLAQEGALRRRVEVHDVAVDVEDHDRVGRRFHHRARALLARLDAPGGARPFECSRGERRDHVQRPRIRLVESLRPPGHQLHHTEHLAVVGERRRDRGPEPSLARCPVVSPRIVLQVSRPLGPAAAIASTRQAVIDRQSEAHLEIDGARDGTQHQLVPIGQHDGHAAVADQSHDTLGKRAEHAVQVVLSRRDIALGLDYLAEPLLLRAEDRLGFALFGQIDDVREDVGLRAFTLNQGGGHARPDRVTITMASPQGHRHGWAFGPRRQPHESWHGGLQVVWRHQVLRAHAHNLA